MTQKNELNEEQFPFLNHLADLRKCLIRALTSLALCFFLALFFVDKVIAFLKAPMMRLLPEHSNFVVLSPQEYFFTELKAAISFGFILAMPYIIYQVWLFIAPGLYKKEKRFFLAFIFFASLCFFSGLAFAYYLVFPPTFTFFIESLPHGVSGSYSIGMLYSFAITLLFAFGIIFQTPLAVFFLLFFDILSLVQIKKARPFVLVSAFIIGALLTPPDPITQIMLAIPAYILFEAGVLIAQICCRAK